jgi:hypothetical protein
MLNGWTIVSVDARNIAPKFSVSTATVHFIHFWDKNIIGNEKVESLSSKLNDEVPWPILDAPAFFKRLVSRYLKQCSSNKSTDYNIKC